MLHLTTTTGLTLHTERINELGNALRAEITAHADTSTVGWRVTIDDLPGMHGGDITVCGVKGDHQDWIEESVQWLLGNLGADAAANPQQFTDPHLSNRDTDHSPTTGSL